MRPIDNPVGRIFRQLVVLVAVAASGCSVANVTFGPVTQGSGVKASEKRDVGKFTAIEVSNAIHLDFTRGKETTVEVTADDNLLPLLVTKVEGDTLRVYVNGSTSSKIGMSVRVTAPQLKGLEVSGASRVNATELEGDTFNLVVSGASTVTLAGKAERLKVNCSGASTVKAAGLAATSITADASGASTVEVNAGEELHADASGASTVRYRGSPQVKSNVSGASRVTKE